MRPIRTNEAAKKAQLTDCSKDYTRFKGNFDGIFREFLAIYLRDSGRCKASVVEDKDPIFVNSFLTLESSLKSKYLAQVKGKPKCDTLAEHFKKNRVLPNIIPFFESQSKEIDLWALNNIFDSAVPHFSSQADAGVAITLFQEYLIMHDTLIPNKKLAKVDKLEIMKRSIDISQLLLDLAVSKFGLNLDKGSKFVAMQNPKVSEYFTNLVTFPIFRQTQIESIPEAVVYQKEVLDSFKADLKPELKRTKKLLIGTSAAAGVLLISTIYLLTRKQKVKVQPSRVRSRVDMEDASKDFNQLPDTVQNIPVLEDTRQYARTDLKPIY